jgi:hypothetical protein
MFNFYFFWIYECARYIQIKGNKCKDKEKEGKEKAMETKTTAKKIGMGSEKKHQK